MTHLCVSAGPGGFPAASQDEEDEIFKQDQKNFFKEDFWKLQKISRV